ncbi:MAG: hypothetical protein PXZ07_02935 [Candidatus Eremiobacteraeota bacterium]|nr:hypothetical protein [Candidatus Eremiobacteraeota bacterium]
MKKDWGFRVLGLSMLLFGVAALYWHRLTPSEEHLVLGDGRLHTIVLVCLGIAYIVGGTLVLLRTTMRLGATAIAVALGVFVLLQIPGSIVHPAAWIGIFEVLGIISGALILVERTGAIPNERLVRGTMLLFGLCVASYAIAQVAYLQYTASLVPAGMPLGQMFWTIFTTIAFALAAIAILTGFLRLLALQLLTAMLVIFGLAVWLPQIVTQPHLPGNWTEFAENFGIAAGAWILVDWLQARAAVNASRNPPGESA